MTPASTALRAYLPHLYAVLDSAQNLDALRWLQTSGLAHQCLFQGRKAIDLAEEAPYLCHFGQQAARLAEAVELVGSSCLVFLVSEAPFFEVRRHLRKILLVKLPDDTVVYFRFYDPRIARALLPTSDAEQRRWLYGRAVKAWLAEDHEGLVELRAEEQGIAERRFALESPQLGAKGIE